MGTRFYIECSVEDQVKLLNSMIQGEQVTVKDIEEFNNGAYDKLNEGLIEVFKKAGMDQQSAEQASFSTIYDKFYKLHCLHNYDMNGFGKLKPEVYEMLEANGRDPVCGSAGGELAKKLFELQYDSKESIKIYEVKWS